MERKEEPTRGSKAERGGDTSRTSSQGRKLSSGGEIQNDRKGDPEIDDDSKVPVTEKNKNDDKNEDRNS